MNQDQEEKGRSLFGPEFDKMVKGLERASKELEGSGVAFKMEEGAEDSEGEKAQQDVMQMLKLALGRIKDKDAQAAGLLEKVMAAIEKYAKPYPKPEQKAKEKNEKPCAEEEYPKPKKAKDEEEEEAKKKKRGKDEEEEEEKGEEEKYPYPKPKKAKKEYILADEKVLSDFRVALGVNELANAVTSIAQSMKALQEAMTELQKSDEEKVTRKIQESSRILNFQLPPEIAGQKKAAEAAQGPGQVGGHPFANFPFFNGPGATGGAT